ncbi:MAG: L,D-transpeptidase family protein [Azonexus sp.]
MLSVQPYPNCLSASRQLLVVLAEHWESSGGRLQRFARDGVDGDWLPVGNPVAVSLGRSGLAWGVGLHPHCCGVGSEKREGDGRAPAGMFAISALFGAAGAESDLVRTAKLPYRPATADHKCVDDPASAYYNRIVDQAAVAQPDWASCENMLRSDQRYFVGAVVAHNAAPPVAGCGSCIFLHVWVAPGMPTAGCTAMSLADMTEIAGWLDGAAAPLLVQLPQAEYERRRADWGLPVFAP